MKNPKIGSLVHPLPRRTPLRPHPLLYKALAYLLLACPAASLAQNQPETPKPLAAQPAPVYIYPQQDGGRLIARKLQNDLNVATYTGGIYIVQQQPDQQITLEFRAENAVVFYSQAKIQQLADEPNGIQAQNILGEIITAVYLEGDVLFDAGHDRITAQRLYYDFARQKALVLDATMRLALPDPANPLYIRAKKIQQHGPGTFAAQNLKLSTDEFHEPHVYLAAQKASVNMTDQQGKPAPPDQASRFDFDLQKVSARVEKLPIFYWPRLAGNTATVQAPPLNSIHTGYGSEYGTTIETEWSLAAMLGIQEPAGVDSRLRLDEFTERGPAVGIEADYKQNNHFGDLRTYLLNDQGEDRLGRFPARHDVQPSKKTRGRASWRHRQFFPLDWQGTFEVSYFSDPDFLESWEEKEFDTEKEQETLAYFKHQRENWAFDFLAKWHLNDFDYTLTELPTAGFHLAGQDIFETLTYYHDGYISRLNERAGDRLVPALDGTRQPWILPDQLNQGDYAFAVSRHEVALPLDFSGLHFVPTVVGTYSYDDTSQQSSTLQGAGGFRLASQLWHVDNNAKSRLWDIDRIRHIIVPEVHAFWADSDDCDVTARDVFNFAIRQRWQTMRGPQGQKRSVDFLSFDAAVTLVAPPLKGDAMPGKFFYSSPEPQFGKRNLLYPDFANLGLTQRQRLDQAVKNFATGDWTWQVSDTTALLGGVNYDITNGNLDVADLGLAIQRSPRLSYYIGDLFVNNADTFRNANSHFLTAGTSYKLNRRYTIALGHQFDIARTEDAYTQVALIREFPHWFSAFVFSIDPARDSFGFAISFWPAGYKDVAIGSRRFTRLTR